MRVAKMMKLLISLADREVLYHVSRVARQCKQTPVRDCTVCGYQGRFRGAGVQMRLGSGCPRCHSMERQRLFALAVRRGFLDFGGREVLHFAPEAIISNLVETARPSRHLTCDIMPGMADRVLNIEALDLPDASFDRIVCSHVLEHVDDAKALAELFRVLRPGGQAVLMVPLVEGWARSYEDGSITDPAGRALHFGQDDHVRYYGADFRDRVRRAGFDLQEFTAEGADSAAHGLARGEKLFLATRSAAA